MKGVREVEMRPTDKPDLVNIQAKAFVVRLDQMDSTEWITAETMSSIEIEDEEGDAPKDEFISVLKRVSRRIKKPSAPDQEGSGT